MKKFIEKIKKFFKRIFNHNDQYLLTEGIENSDNEFQNINLTDKQEFFEIYDNIKKGTISLEDLMITDMVKVMELMSQEEKIIDEKIEREEKQLKKYNEYKPSNLHELNEKEKLQEIFKLIGCDSKSIKKLLEIENIDINRLRKNLYILNNFKFSNIELSIVITQNKRLISMESGELQEKINTLNSYFLDKEIVKDLIYNDSNILNENIKELLEEKEYIFENFDIPLKSYATILSENANILYLGAERLMNSLNLIKDYCMTRESFIETIITDPIVIGIEDRKLLEEYV